MGMRCAQRPQQQTQQQPAWQWQQPAHPAPGDLQPPSPAAALAGAASRMLAATGLSLSLLCGAGAAPSAWPLLAPGPAGAKPRITPDETVTINLFKKATPSVVNVTNLTARWAPCGLPPR